MLVFTMIFTINKEDFSPNAMKVLSLFKGACSTNSTLYDLRPIYFSLQCADNAEGLFCDIK